MQEIDCATRYLNFCNKTLLDIVKILQTLILQSKEARDELVQKRLLDTLEFYEKFIKEGQGNEVFAISDLTYNDKLAIENYINNVLDEKDKNIDEMTLPVMLLPYNNIDGNTDPKHVNYLMTLRQRDVSDLMKMITYFEENNIPVDKLKSKDISIVNDPNSLFNFDSDIQLCEIEIPISRKDIFRNLENFMIEKGYEFNVAPHDNSMGIIYKLEDKENLINDIYSDENNMRLWGTNDKQKVFENKKAVILEGDKNLNDREGQKEKLFDFGKDGR